MIDIAPRVKQCEFCGCDFEPKLPIRRFCSSRCAMKATSRNHTSQERLAEVRAEKVQQRLCHLPETFWNKVDMSHECWEWMGSITSTGYGHLRTNGHNELAHRVAWQITFGAIPDDLWVLHRCDNRKCVRPEHLFLGDHKANMEDCAAKGRTSWGTRSAHARLTENEVLEIRRLYADGGTTYQALADQFNVGMVTVANVITHATWARLEDIQP